jgi:spore germination protein KC
VIRFVGLALFDDGLMVGELNERQMIGFLMLNGFLESAVYTSGMVKIGEPTAKAVTLRLFGPKRKIEWIMENGQPKMKIDFNFKDEVLEINPWYPQKMAVEQFELLESQVERDIEKLLGQVLYIVQKQHRLELFDIRNMARVKWAGHYDKKRWNEQFSKIPIEINVNIQIERTGILY